MNRTEDAASRIAGLSPAKLAMLARRLKEKKKPTERPPLIPRREASETVIPLLPSQQGVWLISHLQPEMPFYNLPGSWPFKGKVNLAALEQALNETVRRHEILRTSFPAVGGEPVQAITPAELLSVPLVDLRGLSPVERWKQATRLGMQEKLRRFDLQKECPLRMTFLSLDHDELVLLHTVHHIVFDAGSAAVFMTEREGLYKAFVKGAPSPLVELPVQCGDIALWHQRWMQGEEAAAHLAYWRETLGGSCPELELPTDRPRTGQPFLGAWQRTQLAATLTAALKRLAHEEGATLFMTLLAGLKGMLSRQTGLDDIRVGTLFSTRNRSECEGLIGPFFNTLIMRTQLRGCTTFRDLIRAVRRTTLAAYSHADYPFAEMVEALRASADLGSGPPFRIKFGMGPAQSGTGTGELFGMAMEGFSRLTALDREHPSSPDASHSAALPGQEWLPENRGVHLDYDLAFYVHEIGDQMQARVWYNSNLFNATTIARLLRHFRMFVEAVVSRPDQPMAAVDLLPPACRHQLLTEWNDSHAVDDEGETFLPLFAAQAERTPDAIAVVCRDEQVSYGELHRRANHLACHLQSYGVGLEGMVGVATGRGIDFLTAMLAVFKVGAAYLPLDPADPSMRLQEILRRSRASVILTTDEAAPEIARTLADMAAEERPALLPVTTPTQREIPADAFPAAGGPRNRAYVIFTSGSTGTPKGAMVEQAGLVNHLRAKVSDLCLTATDTVVQNASERFDISVWQFLAALMVGGRVCIIDDEAAHAPLRLLAVVEREAATVLEAVPSLVGAALDEIEEAAARPSLAALRWLLVTGEAVAPQICARWLSLYPDRPLLNAYGPTECSDDVTHYAIATPPAGEVLHMAIGRPVRNTRLYVLDASPSPVPIGVPGELYVGGKGVGRGYLDEPSRTAEVFIPDPYSSTPGARLYKTGDLACYRPDGNIEYRGRLDHQVKIRGYRIELAEIEVMLSRHPDVQQAVAVAREDRPGDKQLVAYVVAARQPVPTSAELSQFLGERLPDYMRPAAFVMLESLPLTPNGKLDRLALPAPTGLPPSDGEEWVAPDTPIERRLAEIWADMFNGKQVGIFDNFFHLGGHSIKAVRVINRINQAFNVNLSVRNVFEEPTIAGLALLIEETLIERLEVE
ncbi:MAG TPA: amino acid adenylation domain-containing protein [Blastocatellia bacterium]|nr:amino acid adenylation domain-containing protein [Blastocatellia bacterium]